MLKRSPSAVLAHARRVDAYFVTHGSALEESFSHAITECMDAQPDDPLKFIGTHMLKQVSPVVPAVCAHHPYSLMDDGVQPNEWSLLSWTESAGLHRVVFATLRAAVEAKAGGYSSQSSFEFVRGLKSREAVAAVLSSEQVIAGMVDLVWEAAQSLNAAKAATASQLNAKFAAEGGGFDMKYGDLSTFFHGLEGKIGSPNPNIFQAMEREHTASDDSTDKFTTGNYGVTTTSEIEWNFIVQPDKEPTGGWPIETILRGTDRAGIMRQPIDKVELKRRFEERNEQLRGLKEPDMIWEEVIAGCAYTGPMFVK